MPQPDSASSAANDHYFTAAPSTPAQERRFEVTLAGRAVSVTTASGIFSPSGIDKGTAILLKHAPFTPLAVEGESVLDVGCGWGPIVLTAGLADASARLFAVDVNERSLDLTRRNAAALGLTVEACTPDALAEDVTFDRIYSNPPIRVGKEILHSILLQWLPRLKRGGAAWLVVQKNLGADSLQTWLERTLPDEFSVSRAALDKGFRILEVRRAA